MPPSVAAPPARPPANSRGVGSTQAEAARAPYVLSVAYDDGPQRAPNRKGLIREMVLKLAGPQRGGVTTYEAVVLRSQGLFRQPTWEKVTFRGQVERDRLVLTSTAARPRDRIVLEVSRASYEDPFTPSQPRRWFGGTVTAGATSVNVRAEELSRAGKVYESNYDPYWVKSPSVMTDFFEGVDEAKMPAHD